MRESRRYLGLELAGAKNQKTSLAALEYYPKEQKIFLLDIFERISSKKNQTGDEALLELIGELAGELTHDLGPGAVKMGVNVPLGLPPCITCERKTCPLPRRCTVPAVKWMRDTMRKNLKSNEKFKASEITPYTQRPIEIWVRHHLMPHLPESHRFEVDETLGGNKAPLTARIGFLKRHLTALDITEVWPKLTVSRLAVGLGLNKRTVATYRNLETGVHAREEILENSGRSTPRFLSTNAMFRNFHRVWRLLMRLFVLTPRFWPIQSAVKKLRPDFQLLLVGFNILR